ncbi:tetratricopeptide repeat protein [Microbacteriaceae bacterium K1510]|nr:tetratricopeptide repeat protein [Microbacteriaceae bacterium K1510]
MAQPQAKAASDVTDLLRRAAAHHQRGELAQAEPLYNQVLARQPNNFDALHLYGVLMHQRGKPAEALTLIGKALAANTRAPAAHSNHGIVLAVLNRHAEAVDAYERAIALKPDYAEAHNNRGNALRALARTEDALAAFDRALALKSDYAEAHNNRGNALMELGRQNDALTSYNAALAARPAYADALVNRGQCLNALKRADEALADFDKALALNPRHAVALKERGRLLFDRGELAAALDCYDRSLAITPDDAETHARRGLALRDLKRFDEAFAAYDRALALKPDFIDAVVARGNVFYQMGRFAEGLAEYERALAMQPDFAYGFNNRGNALHALGRHDEALASYEQALAIDPEYTEAYNNRGNALVELNRLDDALTDYNAAIASKPFASALVNRGSALRYLDRTDEAMASFDQAIALEPNMPEAHWNKALLCLTFGDYERGLEGYEWRWRGATELAPRGFSQPQWRGEDIAGKTIFLHAEQGFGDSIQMLRYLPLVKAKGARIVLELPDALVPLLGPMAEGVTVFNRGTPLPPFDVHCPLMSLPLAFGTRVETVPAEVPYLHVPAERLDRWRARLPKGETRRIGLVWSGKPSHKNDHNRSIPLARLASWIATPGLSFVSLQREYRDADLPVLAQLPIARIDDALVDFADTAAAVEQCDLVIAVDTAVAHLAGSLGKPLWVLLSHIQDWRWLRERADSPWYPSARLFRQARDGNWDGVIATLSRELAVFAG